MKKLILATLSLLLIMSACQKKECCDNTGFTQELKWKVGEDAAMVVKEIKATTTEIKIEMERTSLCPNESVRLIVEIDGESKFDKRVDTYPFSKNFTVSKNANIKLTTKAEANGKLIECIREGNVDAVLRY